MRLRVFRSLPPVVGGDAVMWIAASIPMWILALSFFAAGIQAVSQSHPKTARDGFVLCLGMIGASIFGGIGAWMVS